MAMTMQGSWTVEVTGREAAYAQRFVIHGAEVGNGVHDGVEGRRVFVRGAHWTLQVQHRPTREGWRDSRQRLGLPRVEDGLLRVAICSNDGGLDEDFDDLMLQCTLPVSRCDHVVYGAVTSHDSGLPFNPRRDDYLVVDAPWNPQAVRTRYPALGAVLEKLYPDRMAAAGGAGAELSPLVIPNGLPQVAVGLLFESRAVDVDAFGGDQAAALQALQASVGRVPFQAHAMGAGVDKLSHAELGGIARIRDHAIRHACDAVPAPGVALRFQRYHRTRAESAGAPYRGNGLREELGTAMSDELGNYLFRFREPRGDAHPDLVIQAGLPARSPGFETAPYDRVANLRRIDLCLPRAACASERQGVGAALGGFQAAVFEYVGPTSLTIIGPASGRCYRFGRSGASLLVDAGDRQTLAGIRSLRCRAAA